MVMKDETQLTQASALAELYSSTKIKIKSTIPKEPEYF